MSEDRIIYDDIRTEFVTPHSVPSEPVCAAIEVASEPVASSDVIIVSRKLMSIVIANEQPEGVGARVRRSIGGSVKAIDPFLILDEVKVALPAGFPDHPHRGFETVTYIFPWSKGSMEHEDFTGRKGVIRAGEAQWMTAGKGIMHAEIPSADGKLVEGVQLWVNLPRKDKMKAPNYQEYTADKLPQVASNGVHARIIAGTALGVSSPTITTNPASFIHFTLDPNASLQHLIPDDHNAVIYTVKGGLKMGGDVVEPHHLITLSRNPGKENGVVLEAGKSGASFLLISGKPIGEPVVQEGPFVMTTKEEMKQCLDDYQKGKSGFQKAKDWKSGISSRMESTGGRKKK